MVNGKFTNCVSHADVYGKNRVGGIAGYKGQSMGWFEIENCSFDGTVTASGEYVGGIVGAGYSASSAPNTMCVVIKSCVSKGKITAKDYVGGILGAEKAIQCWDNGIGRIQNNSFEGTITSDGNNVGGIVGYMASLNRYTKVLNNYFKADCGTTQGIGKVDYVDTSCTNHETKGETTYFNTSEKMPQIKGVTLANHNRTDDPLGTDSEHLCSMSKRSGTYVIDLTASGTCKTHYVGDTLDLTGIELAAEWSDDTNTKVQLDDGNLKISGYNKNRRGVQTITLNYLGAEVEVTVTVLYVAPAKGSVTITLLGDKIHGESGDDIHGLAMGGLEEWIVSQKVEIDSNATVWQALQKLEGVRYENTTGNYISCVTYNGVKLGEFGNGKNSGWMYTLNGTHPLLGVQEQYLWSYVKI